MATFKTREEIEAAVSTELRAALRAATSKVIEVKHFTGTQVDFYTTGDVDKALVKELRLRLAQISLGRSGGWAYVTGVDAGTFRKACHKSAGLNLSVREVDDVQAAIRANPDG